MINKYIKYLYNWASNKSISKNSKPMKFEELYNEPNLEAKRIYELVLMLLER